MSATSTFWAKSSSCSVFARAEISCWTKIYTRRWTNSATTRTNLSGRAYCLSFNVLSGGALIASSQSRYSVQHPTFSTVKFCSRFQTWSSCIDTLLSTWKSSKTFARLSKQSGTSQRPVTIESKTTWIWWVWRWSLTLNWLSTCWLRLSCSH